MVKYCFLTLFIFAHRFIDSGILKARLSGEPFIADPSSDVWSLGLILLSTIGGIDFLNDWKKSFSVFKEDEKALRFMSENVEKIKDKFLEIYSQKYPETLPLIIIIKKNV